MTLFVVSCDNDDEFSGGSFEITTLQAKITEAENLLSTSIEGVNAGNQLPGSLAELQSVVNWMYLIIEKVKSQGEIDDAKIKLIASIDRFETMVVSVAIPRIHQNNGTSIRLPKANLEVCVDPFTIEGKFYIFSLKPIKEYNILFGNPIADGGANDKGFLIKYFSDGSIEIKVSGLTNDWNTVAASITSAPGVVEIGKWIHVSYVNNLTSHTLYIDGVEVLTLDADYAASPHFFPVTIGNSVSWDDKTANAMVQDVRLWKKTLTESEINQYKDGVVGDENGLYIYFPFNTNLGDKFIDDVIGNETAEFSGNIEWIEGGIPPVFEINYTALNEVIANAISLKNEVVEGTNDGDYPIGTLAYLQVLIDSGNDVIANGISQSAIDVETQGIKEKLGLIAVMLVADSEGIYIDHQDPNAVGLRITPNYTPQGDYTVEFNVKVESLFGYGLGDFFNNGEYGIWVIGYNDLTEENVLNSGGLWNFTNPGTGWQGPKSDPLVIKAGIWQHVAIVHDDTARTTALYVDGVQVGLDSDIGAPQNSGWGEMWLGNGWQKMDGFMKDFRLWDVARSEVDLDAPIDGTETGLHIYFPLDKVNGVQFSDVTGSSLGEMRGIEWN